MNGPRRSLDWGFPRWRGYGSSREAITVRLCDRHGCEEPGNCPAPKAPNTRDRWYFCKTHAAEYNAGWDYFEGLDKAEREERTRTENRDNAGYAEAAPQFTVKVGVELINVLFSVTDRRGRFIPGLGPKDFVVEEEGRRQNILHFSPENELPLTLGLLIDTSPSVRPVFDEEKEGF